MLQKKKKRTVGGIHIGVEARPGRDVVCLASEEGPIERLWHKSSRVPSLHCEGEGLKLYLKGQIEPQRRVFRLVEWRHKTEGEERG